MDNWFLGYCLNCPNGVRPGRIEVLCSLRKNSNGKYVTDRLAKEFQDEIGPSSSVFWPQSPAPPQDLTGCVVRFRATRTTEHGDLTTTRDWLRVNLRNSTWEVQRNGFKILEQGPEIQWRHEPRWVKGGATGELIYILQRASSTLIGPWKVGPAIPDNPGNRELISPRNRTFAYAIKDLPSDCIYSLKRGNGSSFDMLLYELDEVIGRAVDLATSKQLAKWLIERMNSVAKPAIERLDHDAPGWRIRIKEEIEAYGDYERQVSRERWNRIESILDDWVFEAESAEKLLQLPKFKAIVEGIAQAKIEEIVNAATGKIETEACLRAKIAVARFDREAAEAWSKVCAANEKYDEVVKDIQSRHDAVLERERALGDLKSHMEDSKARLVKDLAVYQSLMQIPSRPAVAESLATPRPVAPPEREAVTDGSNFVDSRLWPFLSCWHPGLSRSMSVILHGAVCGSKAVLIPSPAWARAYADALGTFASLTVLNVEPTWLGFGDIWRGGLGKCVESANQHKTRIELVLLRDFNRALPQCYARPLLDVIAGYCDRLPEPARGEWPSSLRLFACPAPPDEALPLTAEVLRHFAAIEPDPVASTKERPPPLIPGHVTPETWSQWLESASPAERVPAHNLFQEFGPLAFAATAESASIAKVLQACGFAEREARDAARDARISDPARYGPRQESAIGAS